MARLEPSYIERLDDAEDKEKFPLVREWINRAPLPFFDALRTHRPVLETPVATLLAKHEDVYEVLRLPTIFTVDLYKPSVGDHMLALNGNATHSREKGIMRGMLNRDDLPALRVSIGEWASELLDAAGGGMDLVGDYGRMVPVTLVQRYFGLDGVEPLKQIEWSYRKQVDTFHNLPFDACSESERESIRSASNEAGLEMQQYVVALLSRRAAELRSGSEAHDIVSRMLLTQFPAAVEFPIERLARNVGGLLVGAIETTSQAVVQVVQEILSRSDVLEEATHALGAGEVDLFDAIVWEALRFNPIAPFLPRIAAQDYVVAAGTERATRIRKGTPVMALTLSAMFDPGLFPDPLAFRADRPLDNYFHFGHGLHECLGKYVGSVMIPEMVRQVLLRPNVSAKGKIDFEGTPYPQKYPVSWENSPTPDRG